MLTSAAHSDGPTGRVVELGLEVVQRDLELEDVVLTPNCCVCVWALPLPGEVRVCGPGQQCVDGLCGKQVYRSGAV